MRAAASASDFLADPIGRYYAGRSFVTWAQTAQRVGTAHFGVFDLADRDAVVELYALPVHAALATPYDVVFDISAVDAVTRVSFELLSDFLRLRIADLRQ